MICCGSMIEKSSLINDVKNKFRKECVVLLVNTLKKIKERSKLKHLFVRDATAFDPAEMVNNTADAIIKANRCIQAIYQHGVILEKESDNAKDQYEIIVSTKCVKDKDDVLSFNINEDRLDLYLAKYLVGAKEYSNLWKVVKILLIISHGQSDVERGFSVNKEVSVQNMQKNL